MSILEFRNVTHSYDEKRLILNDTSYAFESGKVYSLVGKSGCGKTTALSLMGALESPKKGNILYKNQDIKKIGESNYRRKDIAIIFQAYNLIPYMTALQNVITGMEISNTDVKDRKEKAIKFLKDVGINEEEANRNVLRLSGGQQQRVSIARALACNVELILADEPTGNLDDLTANEILKIFRKLANDGKCIVIVTHSKNIADMADKVLTLQNGKIIDVEE